MFKMIVSPITTKKKQQTIMSNSTIAESDTIGHNYINNNNNNIITNLEETNSSSGTANLSRSSTISDNNKKHEHLLRQEVAQLKSQLKSVTKEKVILQQTFVSIQERVKKDIESSLSIQAQNYESQITELHSIIGELKRQLVEVKENRIIEEQEDEQEQEGDGRSNNNGVTEEVEVKDSQNYEVTSSLQEKGRTTETNADTVQESIVNPLSSSKRDFPATLQQSTLSSSSSTAATVAVQKELVKIRNEHLLIRKALMEKELLLNTSKWKIQNLVQENHFLQTRIHQLEKCLLKKESVIKSTATESTSTASTADDQQNRNINIAVAQPPYVCKKAERTQLKKSTHLMKNLPHNSTSAESAKANNNNISSSIVLTDSIRLEAQLEELKNQGSSSKKEYELEIEKLHYALQSQNATIDILQYNLQEGKELAESLTLLLGKYESYFITMEYLFGYSDQMVEAYDVLVALLESELGQLVANCRAVGIGSGESPSSHNGSGSYCSSGIGSSTSPTQQHQQSIVIPKNNNNANNNNNEELLEIATLLQRANENRLVAECAAKALLGRIMENGEVEEGSVELYENPLLLESPEKSDGESVSWDETVSSTKSSNYNSLEKPESFQQQSESIFTKSKLNKITEIRIRGLIIQLKTKSDSLRSTLNLNGLDWNLENESHLRKMKQHISSSSSKDSIEARRNDLEIAILMHELMALKEERAELRSQIYYSEKGRKRLEECLERWKIKEAAYKDQIFYLKNGKCILPSSSSEPSTPNAEFFLKDDDNQFHDSRNNNNNNATDSNSTIMMMSKEKLIDTINKLNEALTNCEVQNQLQLVELSQSNQILADNLNSTKIKYEKRLRKMEEGIIAMVEKYGNQIKNYKQTIQCLQVERLFENCSSTGNNEFKKQYAQ